MSVINCKQPKHIAFFLPYFLFWSFGIGALLFWQYEGSFLILNKITNEYFPYVFVGKYLTLLGDWTVNVALLLIFFRKKTRNFLLKTLLILSIVGIAVQLFKHLGFADWQRPLGVFGEAEFFYSEVIPLTSYTFPSGHSATSAAMFLLFALFSNGKTASFFYGVLGVLTAFSRVYIGAHFLGDTLAGSFLGIALTCGLVFLFKLGQSEQGNRLSRIGAVGIFVLIVRLGVNFYLDFF